MISLTRISKQYGRQILFVDASFQLNPGETVGLVGPNGSGKTTLFRLITGEEAPDEGEISIPKKVTVGYFRQDVEEMSGRSVLDEAILGSGRVGDLHHELEQLHSEAQRACPASDELARLTEEVRWVNERLWDIEDEIRRCEAAGDFGDRFIGLARSVYRENDRRAHLKRRINELLGSTLIEEKSYARWEQCPE